MRASGSALSHALALHDEHVHALSDEQEPGVAPSTLFPRDTGRTRGRFGSSRRQTPVPCGLGVGGRLFADRLLFISLSERPAEARPRSPESSKPSVHRA